MLSVYAPAQPSKLGTDHGLGIPSANSADSTPFCYLISHFCSLLISATTYSAFYIGYTLTNLVGGYLASTWSAKQVLGAGVVLWSIFTITTPIAAAGSLPLLLGNRALMGAGEGVTFPCVQNIVKFWCPGDVRSRALALIYSGGQLGTIVALVTAPLIIQVR